MPRWLIALIIASLAQILIGGTAGFLAFIAVIVLYALWLTQRPGFRLPTTNTDAKGLWMQHRPGWKFWAWLIVGSLAWRAGAPFFAAYGAALCPFALWWYDRQRAFRYKDWY